MLKEDKLGAIGFAYLISEDVPRIIIGRVLTQIDIAGLPQEQSKALKDLIRQGIEDGLYGDSIFISEERHKAIREEYEKKKSEANEEGEPMSAV